MKILSGDRWKRKGITVLWDPAALAQVAKPNEVLTLREFARLSQAWPDELPGDGKRIVVTGLKGVLEVLSTDDAAQWLESDFRGLLNEFQKQFQGEIALILWFPSPAPPFKVSAADEAYSWEPHGRQPLAIGHYLWSGNERDLLRVVRDGSTEADGSHWIGLFDPCSF